jgi:hypothetical protein
MEPDQHNEWYVVGATSHFGYPQPEDGYAKATYDVTGYCERCGAGGVQRRPFRFRSEPKASHSQFLQLNWIFDELFVRPEVPDVFERERVTGVGSGPALHHRTGRALEGIQQLIILTILPPGLQTDGLQTVTCKPDNEEARSEFAGPKRYPPDYPFCGRVKYHWRQPLFFAPHAFAEAPDIAKSHEWFGSGGDAHRAILVSARVVDLIKAHKWRGLRTEPVALSDAAT